MRLDKFLAHAGYGTRREVKRLIEKKLVFINQALARRPDDNVEEIDVITVDGHKVNYQEFYYILMNKPRGVLSATVDKSQKTIMDLIPFYQKLGLAPVGRLDLDTTGVMLITNHGRLAHNLISPSHHVQKIYRATVDQEISEDLSARFEQGIVLEDGYVCRTAFIKCQGNTALLTIEEGKYHQVKRMMRAVGYKVVALHREQFADLRVDDLQEGEYRSLKKEEIEHLLTLL